MRAIILVLAASVVFAQGQPRSRVRFGPGVCGPVDPSYIRLATETGGQAYITSSDELPKLANVMSESHSSVVFSAGGAGPDAADSFTIPVDPTITRLTFSAMFDGKGGNTRIVMPDGKTVEPNTLPDDAVLNCGRIVSVDAPIAGEWRMTLEPTERFWVVVYGRSERRVSAEFVRSDASTGGWVAIEGQPLTGRSATLKAVISSPAETPPAFVLLSESGRPLKQVALDRQEAGDSFVGPAELPAVPFRVAAIGTDSAGVRYQRVDPRLLRTAPVEVVPGGPDIAAAGAETSLTFTVRNLGPRARYRVTATARGSVLERVVPERVELDEGASQQVTVWLPLPPDISPATTIEVMAVASTDETGSTTSNYAVQRVRVKQ